MQIMRGNSTKKYLLIFAIILCIYSLYVTAEMRTFSHYEEKNYGNVIPRVWYTKIYDDDTIVVRIVRVKPTITTTCFYETFSLRIIHSDGTVDEKDFELDIQQFNYCLPFNVSYSHINIYNTQYEQSDIVEFLGYHLISKDHILITYYNATEPNNIYTYEEWGMIIDFDGKLLSKTPFGPAFINETTYQVTPISRIRLNVNREKGFLRVAVIGKGDLEDMEMVWQQYRIELDGSFTKLTSGILEFGNFSSLDAIIMSTVDEGYAIAYANTTNNFITTDPLLSQGQLSVLPIGYNRTSTSSLVLYQTPIPNIAFPVLSCDIAFTEVGQVCTLIVSQYDPNGILLNEYFYVKVNFLSSGSVTNLTVANLDSVIRNIFDDHDAVTTNDDADINIALIVTNLPFGGYLLTRYFYTSDGLFDVFSIYGYLYGEYDTTYTPWEFPEPAYTTNGVFQVLHNNTLLVNQMEANNYWQFQVIDLPALPGDKDKGYSNANVDATFPEIQSSIDPGIPKVLINFHIPVELSSGHLSIYQVIDGQKYLRQSIPGKLCLIGNDGKTVSADVLESTLSVSKGNYFITVDNNFVRDKAYDEPLLGIRENAWKFTTEERNVTFSPSATGILRLTSEGTQEFDNLSLNTLLEELSIAVPLSSSRLTIESTHIDNSLGEERYLIFISIKDTRDEYDNSVKFIMKIIDIMIRKKDQTPIGLGQATRYLDESFGFIPAPELWKTHKFNFIGLFLIAGFLIGLFLLAELKSRSLKEKCSNVVILQIGVIIFDLVMNVLFVSDNAKYVPILYIPSVVFLTFPIAVNVISIYNIVSRENAKPRFFRWFTYHGKISSIIIILAVANIDALNILQSNLAGLRSFKAPYSDSTKSKIFWSAFMNIFIKNVPQLTIQVFYRHLSVSRDIIPLLTLVASIVNLATSVVIILYQITYRVVIPEYVPNTPDVNENFLSIPGDKKKN